MSSRLCLYVRGANGRLSLPFSALLWGALGVAASACSNTTKLPAPFIFDRPGEVELVCFNQSADDAAKALKAKPPGVRVDDDFVLPAACCTGAGVEGADAAGVAKQLCPPGVKHALITQTVRGEVAAVDLNNEKVLDSERRVPGYTFVDVGPFPAAIVVPQRLPGSEAADRRGPAWTYVAGVEASGFIRAIPTCRFLIGKECGPEIALKNEVARDGSRYRSRTQVNLEGTPENMLLDPSGRALWVTLPDTGLLARVRLGTRDTQPFATDDTAPLGEPEYYALPSGDGRQPSKLKMDVHEVRCEPNGATEVVEVGELSLEQLQNPDRLPGLRLPRAPAPLLTGTAEPARMRYFPGGDSEGTPLLFVADRGQALLHVIALSDATADGAPEVRASLPVNMIITDFAITPKVRNPDGSEQQYVYAVDREGTVAAFELTFVGTTPALTPLQAPQPRRVFGSTQRLYSDRLLVGAGETSSVVLDVVHTNAAANPATHVPSSMCSADIENDWFSGVFVVVASRSGVISVLDVFDDASQVADGASCRCSADDDERVATRRHAPRLNRTSDIDVAVSSSSSLVADCAGAGYVQPDDEAVCVPTDPWRQRIGTWTAQWQGALATVGDGALMMRDDGKLEIRVPVGTDLCEQGVIDPTVDDSVGLQVAVVGQPGVDTDCVIPTSETAQLLTVREVFSDRVVVDVGEPIAGRQSLSIDELMRCYPDRMDFQVRVSDTFVVLGPNGVGQHRVIADSSSAERRCVYDDRIDPSITSIVAPDGTYRDPYIAFHLSETAVKSSTSPLTIAIPQAAELYAIPNVDGSSGRGDALPARVRFFPETNDLFVVDGASQGLRRYSFEPFEADDSRYR